MDILSVGEIVIDFLPGGPGVYIRKPGGAPANVAVAMSRLGRGAAFCGCAGDDDFGRFLLDTLRQNGVLPLLKLTKEAITTMAFVSLNEYGERSFTFARKPGADMYLTAAQVEAADISRFGIVHAGSCSLSGGSAAEATVYALKEAARQRKLVSFDVNYRDLLWDGDRAAAAKAVQSVLPYVDLLKVSDDETDMVGGEEVLPLLRERYGISAVVETLGRDGARCFFDGKTLLCPGIPSDAVDTTGAGDAFWGGFLSTLCEAGVTYSLMLSENLILSAMKRGCAAGALCVKQKGAMESLPTSEALNNFLKELSQ